MFLFSTSSKNKTRSTIPRRSIGGIVPAGFSQRKSCSLQWSAQY
jgi:hypothetical protein